MPFKFSRGTEKNALEIAQSTLQIEINAILALKKSLQAECGIAFVKAISLMLNCTGRVVITGIGKSGHIARKIAATLSSTGTPALFVHAAEAAHGDLGMIAQGDCLIAISYSGEAEEVLMILPSVRRMGAQVIAITGNQQSSLAKLADVHLDVRVEREACPLNLAPTASTTVTLALGDALAVALLNSRGFGKEDFALSHPGGVLGRKLLTRVLDIMRTGDALPLVLDTTPLSVALLEMTKKGMAMTAVVDENDRLVGIFTDGDLRRLIEKAGQFLQLPIQEVMHRNPLSVQPSQLAVDAVAIMEEFRINQLLVTENKRLVGALHIHDLTRAKVI